LTPSAGAITDGGGTITETRLGLTAGAVIGAAGNPLDIRVSNLEAFTPTGGIFPNLAGLTPEYIAKQLADFRQGTRKQPLMNTIAQAGLAPLEDARARRGRQAAALAR